MARLYLVRHAQADAGWGDDPDPGLSPEGVAQAEAMAERLGPLGPLPMITSPLRRARQTAAALERRWHTLAIVEPGVGEVPSPSDDLAERQAWLQQALRGSWPDLGVRYESWRTMVASFLGGINRDTVVVTHFVLINAAIGAATGDDRVWCRSVGNAAVVVLESGGHELALAGDLADSGAPAPAPGTAGGSAVGPGAGAVVSGEAADPGPVL